MSKEELTTKMHSEFNVSPETDVKHIAFAALSRIKKYGYTMEEVLSIFDITEKQILQHEAEFNRLASV